MTGAPPHVAVLSPLSRMGGAETSLVELIRRLHGVPRVSVIVPDTGPLRDAASAAGAPTHILPWPRRLQALGDRAGTASVGRILRAALDLRPFARQLAILLTRIEADVLVTNGIKAHVVGAAARRRSNIPLIWYLRDGLEGRRMSARLLRRPAHNCAGAIAISNYLKTEFRHQLKTSVPVHVLYNIIDTDAYRPGNLPPADLHKPPGEIWYGTIGAITSLKGQDLFLQAAVNVLRAVPTARFFIVGTKLYDSTADVHFEQTLRASLRDQALETHVCFLGQRQDVPRLLSVLDVVVQPNRGPEGLGRSVLEAMTSGLPVIAVNRWGPAEIIRDEETGVLVPWMDTTALARQMVRLGQDAGLRRRLGLNARAWVLKHLDADRIVAEFRRIVNRILANDEGVEATTR